MRSPATRRRSRPWTSLAAPQDKVLERLEKSHPGRLRTEAEQEETAESWYAKSENNGNLAPQRKLANEKPQGDTVDYDTLIRGLSPRHAAQAGRRGEVSRCRFRLIRPPACLRPPRYAGRGRPGEAWSSPGRVRGRLGGASDLQGTPHATFSPQAGGGARRRSGNADIDRGGSAMRKKAGIAPGLFVFVGGGMILSERFVGALRCGAGRVSGTMSFATIRRFGDYGARRAASPGMTNTAASRFRWAYCAACSASSVG